MDIRKAFWILLTLIISIEVTDRILFVLFPNYLISKNFTAIQIGFVFSLASLILVFSRFFIGKLSDVWGRKRIMSAGLLLESVSISLFPNLSRIGEYGFVKGLKEVSRTLSSSVEDSIIADTFRKKIRAKVLSKFGAGVTVGRALGAIAGFLIATYLSITYGFYIASLLIFISFLIFFLFFKERKRTFKRKFKISIKSYLNIKIIATISFLASICYSVAYFPAFFILAKNIGISTSMLFLLLFGTYIISSIFTYWSGGWIDKVGRVKTLIVSSLLISVFTALYSISSDIYQFFFVLVGISISFYLWRIAFKTIMMDRAVPRIRGEQIGFIKTIQGIGDTIGPVLGGLLIDFISLSSAFWVASAIGILATILSIYLK